MVRHPKKIQAFKKLSSQYGIRDILNLEFIQDIQNLHRKRDKEKDKEKKKMMAADIIAKCEDLENKFGLGIFNPFLWAAGMFFWSKKIKM